VTGKSRSAPQKRPELIGRVLSERYRVDALVASGSFGAVYRGVHLHMKKQVAIKVLHPDVENFPELVERFQREAMAGAHITHPNVAAASDLGTFDGDSYFLVQEYVRGETLREAIDKGAFASARAAYIARQIAAGLGGAHRHKILHRDLKAANVMLIEGADDFVKLIDFGFARVPLENLPHLPDGTDETEWLLSEAGVVFGTPAYMSPEVALGMRNVDERADLYALGILMYEMLTGKHPFDDSLPGPELFQQQKDLTPPPMKERNPDVDVPAELEALVMRLLAKDPDERPSSASDTVRAIDAAMRSVPGYFDRGRSDRFRAPKGVIPETPPPPVVVESEPEDAPAAKSVPASLIMRQLDVDKKRKLIGSVFAMVALGAVGVIVVERLTRETPVESAKSAEPLAVVSAPVPAPSASAKKESFQQRYARDLREQLIAKAEQGNIRDAATSLLGLVEEDNKAFEDERVQISAATLAKRMASTDETTQKVFYALAHKTGSAGLDVLYRVYDETPPGTSPWQRSESILALAAAGKRMSKELRIAWELRRSSCDQKHLLFERAGNDGDDRTLRLLTELAKPGCNKRAGECCYGRDLKLKKASAHIEDRHKAPEP
jgi:serine/threonine-protein kinase